MPDFRCKAYIEVEMVISAKDCTRAYDLAHERTSIDLSLDVRGADLILVSYDDSPNWEIEDDTQED